MVERIVLAAFLPSDYVSWVSRVLRICTLWRSFTRRTSNSTEPLVSQGFVQVCIYENTEMGHLYFSSSMCSRVCVRVAPSELQTRIIGRRDASLRVTNVFDAPAVIPQMKIKAHSLVVYLWVAVRWVQFLYVLFNYKWRIRRCSVNLSTDVSSFEFSVLGAYLFTLFFRC